MSSTYDLTLIESFQILSKTLPITEITPELHKTIGKSNHIIPEITKSLSVYLSIFASLERYTAASLQQRCFQNHLPTVFGNILLDVLPEHKNLQVLVKLQKALKNVIFLLELVYCKMEKLKV
jgi:hypothetical protein